MRRIGALLTAILAVAAAGAGAAFLVAGQARAGSAQDCLDEGCPTTTATTTTTVPTVTAPVTTTAPVPTVTTPPTTTTVTPTEPDRPPARRHPHVVRPAPPQSKPAPARTTHVPKGTLPIQHATPPLRGGPYVFPVYGPVSFSDTFGSIRADTSWHHGASVFAPLGAPVLAVADGTLFVVGWNRVGGNRLWLRDRRGNYFYYAHLSALSSLSVNGARVTAGTVIGFVGNTGDARGTPYQLHFEIHPAALVAQGYDVSAVDPTSYLQSWKRAQTFNLGSSDARLARSTGWAAAVALPSAASAPAGAVLLQVTDISRARGLAHKQVKQALVPAVRQGRPQPLWRSRSQQQQPVYVFGPRERAQARIARSLDRGAQLPFGLPTVWDTVAQCEAGGDWSTNTGNGFYGGLQFTSGTWLAHGGGEFAPSAEQATRDQQIAVAERVLVDQGWRAWPACSLKLGLR